MLPGYTLTSEYNLQDVTKRAKDTVTRNASGTKKTPLLISEAKNMP